MTKPSEAMSNAYGKIRAAKSAVEGYGGIFSDLADDHGAVAALMKRIASTSGESDTRRELFEKCRHELLAHAHAESREFYTVLREHAETRHLAEESETEHKEIEGMLSELQTADISTSSWLQRFEQLKRLVEHHVEQEENDVFPKAKDFLSKEESKRIGERFSNAKKAEMKKYA